MAKKRTMNEYRQTKDTFYKVPPKIGSGGEVHPEVGDDHLEPSLYDRLIDLRKKYPNDQEFGYHVAKELL